MPFIDSETLRDQLNRETQSSVDEAVRTTRGVADALDYADRQGVIQRDIKPENVLLANGRPMVANFGIALAVSAPSGSWWPSSVLPEAGFSRPTGNQGFARAVSSPIPIAIAMRTPTESVRVNRWPTGGTGGAVECDRAWLLVSQ